MCNVIIMSLFSKHISSYKQSTTQHVLYRALLFTSLFTNKFFCLGSTCLSNKPKTKAQFWLIYKQTNMNELFIEPSLSWNGLDHLQPYPYIRWWVWWVGKGYHFEIWLLWIFWFEFDFWGWILCVPEFIICILVFMKCDFFFSF